MTRFHLSALCLLAVLAFAAPASAHIKMLKPTPWITTDALGNPQKQGPCGTTAAGSAATGEITTFTAGEEITVEWTETIDHPGHFRIALAKDRSEFEDPDLEPPAGTCDYPAGSVPTAPHGNVLLDNLFPTTGASTNTYSQKVKLPDEPCEKCTLQLIQWMTKHPPSCLYYQCADIKIVAKGTEAAGSAAPAAGSGGKAAEDAGAEPAPTDETASDGDDGGCSVGHVGRKSSGATFVMSFGLLAWAWAWTRRRRRS